ncbi:putative cfem domain-containing protein [Rosellinia necatrix]|uniref:Putative cfem domain-containing protein n=1 Tax=Rosellinia necatrix TaxID=77044 RepID=A0A1W2TK95_ROSNE|nr:putative cfem domain-containing protein [Rosellinia necatrix]
MASLSNDDRGPGLRSYIIVLLVLTFAAISLRFWSRSLSAPQANRRTRFWWDDWAALAAVPIIVTEFALIFHMISLGLGRHIRGLSDEQIAGNLLTIYVVYFVYDTALFLTKMSALLFLSRVFPRYANHVLFNWGLWITHGLNVSWLLGIVFGTLFMCDPVAKGYNPNLPGYCSDVGKLWVGSAVPSVVIDLIILLLPMPKVWGLQMSGARKIGITVAFALGYIVIIVSLGRLITVIKSAKALSEDLTYEGVPALYWLCAEAPITLTSICIPALLPLWRHLAERIFGPISSKVSSVVSSNRTRRAGGQGSHGSGGRYFRKKPSDNFNLSTLNDAVSIHSTESRRKILVVPPSHQQYSAQVRAETDSAGTPPPGPDQSIYVAKTVEVDSSNGPPFPHDKRGEPEP